MFEHLHFRFLDSLKRNIFDTNSVKSCKIKSFSITGNRYKILNSVNKRTHRFQARTKRLELFFLKSETFCLLTQFFDISSSILISKTNWHCKNLL